MARIPDEVYWGNGYITEVIATILEVARVNGIHKVVSGADIHNFGSFKAQIKCGMKYDCLDDDNDPEFVIDLDENTPLVFPSIEEIEAEWDRTLKEEIYPALANVEYQKEWEESRVNKLNELDSILMDEKFQFVSVINTDIS